MRKAVKATQASLLRKSILQAAVEGKLVPQDPSDEPASQLLARIKAEKAQLIKEGKLKKEKPLPAITEDEKPFVLPEGWEWMRLGEIGDWGAGATPLRSNGDFYLNGTVNWLKTGELNNGIVYESEEKITEKALTSCSLRMNQIGDILIAMYGATIGKLAIVGSPMTTNQACCGCTPFTGVYNKYLFCYLKAIKDTLVDQSEGGAQPNISRIKIRMSLFAFPPLAEQKRIVAKVDELMHHCDQLEKAEQAATALDAHFFETLPKSFLQAAVQGKIVSQDDNDEPASILLERIKKEKTQLIKDGKLKKEKPLPVIEEEEKPFALPKGWEWCRLGEIGDWGAGATPLRSNGDFYLNGTINWLKTGELNNGIVYESEEKITEKALTSCSLRMNQIGDVLIAMYGATIGKLAIVGSPMTTNQACCGCTPFTGVYNKYLFYYLKAMKDVLVDQGEGGAQPNISRTKIRMSLLALPPLAEQKRIVAKIEEFMQNMRIKA